LKGQVANELLRANHYRQQLAYINARLSGVDRVQAALKVEVDGRIGNLDLDQQV
jgi:hypothetical protein